MNTCVGQKIYIFFNTGCCFSHVIPITYSSLLTCSEVTVMFVWMHVGCCICSYLFSLRMPQFATRATLLSTECLKGRSLYGEAAKQFIRMTSEDSDLRSALLLEQASYCFLKSTRPHMMRKYAFHIVLAGHRFSKAGQRKHSLRCYKQAYQVINLLPYFLPPFFPSFLSTLLAFDVLPCLCMSAALFNAIDATEWLRIGRLLWLPRLQWNLVYEWYHKQGFHDHDTALFVSGTTTWVSVGGGFQWLSWSLVCRWHQNAYFIGFNTACWNMWWIGMWILSSLHRVHLGMWSDWVTLVSTVTMFPGLSQSFSLWLIPEQVFHWKPGFCGDMSHTHFCGCGWTWFELDFTVRVSVVMTGLNLFGIHGGGGGGEKKIWSAYDRTATWQQSSR